MNEQLCQNTEDVVENKMVTANQFNFFFERGSSKLHVLDNLNFAIGKHEFFSLVGPSGCGKTTLLKAVGGLYSPRTKGAHLTGTILVEGKPPDVLLRDCKVGFVFQNPVLLPWRSVLENIRLPLEIAAHRRDTFSKPEELVGLMGLTGFEHALPHQLSGGMQQRVNMARCLLSHPDLMLMDEPFGGLDDRTRERLNLELRSIFDQGEVTILFVTHNLQDAVFLSDRILVLSARPARILCSLQVKFPKRTLEIKETRDFVFYLRSLRSSIEQEGKS